MEACRCACCAGPAVLGRWRKLEALDAAFAMRLGNPGARLGKLQGRQATGLAGAQELQAGASATTYAPTPTKTVLAAPTSPALGRNRVSGWGPSLAVLCRCTFAMARALGKRSAWWWGSRDRHTLHTPAAAAGWLPCWDAGMN